MARGKLVTQPDVESQVLGETEVVVAINVNGGLVAVVSVASSRPLTEREGNLVKKELSVLPNS